MNIKEEIKKILQPIATEGKIDLTEPPKPEMGDLSLACFALAKEMKKNPAELAKEIKEKIDASKNIVGGLIERVEVLGPYVNFFLNSQILAKNVLSAAEKKDFGQSKLGKGKKIMVEFAHPNTHKAFHIGHLRNITTGESLARIFTNAGYKVVRTNYQGDVGLHIAKCLWGIKHSLADYEAAKKKNVIERAAFLGLVYAKGGRAYEADEKAKQEIAVINEEIYSGADKEINKIYKETRGWSLEYFNQIYKRVGANFDRLYFESEVFKRGKKLVLENLKQGIFKESQGAVIFEGEKYGLHNRVFLNNKELHTYEAKDLALAELQLREYKPEIIFHVVGKEQTEYFKVVFKALESVLPYSQGKEHHLVYGWVTLKEGKMSSRTGNVILGEWLLEEIKKKIRALVGDHQLKNAEEVAEKVAIAAVKYSFLRTNAVNDIAFDINESISLTGDSGPYLLYIVARIRSILEKADKLKKCKTTDHKPEEAEKKLLLVLANYPDVVEKAAVEHDPSKIAHYLLSLAQAFNNFYDKCPVLKVEGGSLQFRLNLIKLVSKVMSKGLFLLGIDTVEKM